MCFHTKPGTYGIPFVVGFAAGGLLIGLVIGVIVGMTICRCRRQPVDEGKVVYLWLYNFVFTDISKRFQTDLINGRMLEHS